ncbi:family 16 glycosylhydrolase [Fulvivirgaceae bacterium BMA10]|uniref:Family 16 glycosylhydrolase n=1 Tax=Splendidivirga corallicola TaxID=3051826 RepID=A0ABT8KWE1_9BACT|nr:family 16 glycosylhydrolase [Fulvivirgaceae bacterium BMA10]
MKTFHTIALPFIAFTLLTACKSSHKIGSLKPSTTVDYGNWKYDSSISDEFDQSQLDTTKWYDTNPTWIGRAPALFRSSNVELKDGMMVLTGKRENVPNAPEGYHTFTTAAVQSKRKVLYGYFEIRCKPMKSALSSAFWLYTPDSVKQEEIDIFEICGRHDTDTSYEHTYFATTHYIIKKRDFKISDHVAHKTEYKLADQFIVAGLKWTREEIIWYLNGEEIRRRKNDFWHSPETINFDSEAFPTWWGLPSDEDNGGTFEIDYFRYWSQVNESDQSYRN